jgi:hypothetical protein
VPGGFGDAGIIQGVLHGCNIPGDPVAVLPSPASQISGKKGS